MLIQRAMIWLLERYWHIRRRYKSIPHFPTYFFSMLFWWYYQVYTCGYLAFIEDSFWCQLFYSVIVCGGIGMTAASVIATTQQRFPLPPKELAIDESYYKLDPIKQQQVIDEVINRVGLNRYHVRGVCDSCLIVRPERSHHCAVCDVCTPRLDHHCVVLHKCIHQKNTKTFALFFFWMSVSFASALYSIHSYLVRSAHSIGIMNGPFYYYSSFTIIGYSNLYVRYLGNSVNYGSFPIIALVFSSNLAYFMLMIFLTVFLNFMYWCVILSHTILACNKATRLRKSWMPFFLQDMKTRCFRKATVVENIQAIFGRNPLFWPIPIVNNDTNGWLHSCDCAKQEVQIA
ncbi:hypothetical protein M3Y96_01146100 [Aphelenchoides besseyi]|nr:hypothetical protein M3Y96_01146100 [Aphelenchoides besseyi]